MAGVGSSSNAKGEELDSDTGISINREGTAMKYGGDHRKNTARIDFLTEIEMGMRSGSRIASPEQALLSAEVRRVDHQRLIDLDLMIANGYGEMRQEQLPLDWRTKRKDGTLVR